MTSYDLFPNISGNPSAAEYADQTLAVPAYRENSSQLIFPRKPWCVLLGFVYKGWVTHPLWCLSSSWSTVWSQYSNTRWSLRFLLKTSIRLTRLGCLSCWKHKKRGAKLELWKTVFFNVGPTEERCLSFRKIRLGLKEAVDSTVLSSLDELFGLPGRHGGKEFTCQCRRCRRCRFDPWVGKIPWRRKWQPTPAFLPGKSHGQWSLVGYIVHGVAKSWIRQSNWTCTHVKNDHNLGGWWRQRDMRRLGKENEKEGGSG